MTLLIDFVIVLLAFFASIAFFFKWKYSYWRNKNIPYIEPRIPFGTARNPFTRNVHLATVLVDQYHQLKSLGYKYGGIYFGLRPSLLAVDVEFIRDIMSTNFQHFSSRGTFYNEKDDPLSANLFNVEGHRWRHLRTKITPTFTSGKIKMMFPILIACGEQMIASVSKLAIRQEPLDIKDIYSRFSTDVIGSCAFGLDCNSFAEPESDFRRYGRIMQVVSTKRYILRILIIFSYPKLAKYLGLNMFESEPKEFLFETVKNSILYRTSNNVIRNDFIQLLMNLEREDGEGLTLEQIAAQSYAFWFAGFETSSTAMTFCLYELASNLDIQEAVRKEIYTVLRRYRSTLCYEAISEMKYLSQVIEETLRKYPPGAVVPRICVEDYPLPDTQTIVPKGTRVAIPVYAVHHDPEYYPNPDKFDPERFSAENKGNIRPYTYLPFGEGPRICVAIRFALLQTKVGVISMLKNFKFVLNTRTKVPLQYDHFSLMLRVKDGVWLNAEKISDDGL